MPSLDGFTKRNPETPQKAPNAASTSLTTRIIATNSRVKQEERLRKDMYLAFVNNALQEKSMGKREHYDELVDQFSLKHTSPESPSPIPQLRQWIQALTHVVSQLDRSHSALVDAIIRMPWMTMDVSFVKSYTSFIGILVSARPEYLSVVLSKIAQGFTYHSGLQALDSSVPESSSAPLTRRVVYDRIHELLQHLLSLIPTLSSTLQPLLVRNFPHKRLPKSSQVTYIKNMLRIMEYCPELADKLLSTIVDRAIQIDVEIQVELEELEEAEAAQQQPELFEIDPFDTVVGQEEEVGSDGDFDDLEVEGDGFSDISSEAEDENEEPRAGSSQLDVAHITDMVGKLDAILKLIFDHFQTSLGLSMGASSKTSEDSGVPPHSAPNEPTSEERHALLRYQFQSLLSIFNRTILRTFKSRYTQFLLFWFTSLSPEFTDAFLGELVSKALLEAQQPTVTRAAAASYIGSFVSRATFIDRAGARRVVRILCQFMRAQLDLYESSAARQAVPPTVFYAVIQAVFLMFCFRWRDFMEDDTSTGDADEFGTTVGAPNKIWMSELNVVQRAVTSAMNPLRICSENVVIQFARIAQATGFVYVYPILEANRRREFVPTTPLSPEASTPTSTFGESIIADLNTFFPFDPYKLPKSSSYVEPVYREWSAVAIDDEEDDEEEAEEGVGVAGARVDADGAVADRLGASFGGMSISPTPAIPPQMAMSVSMRDVSVLVN